MAGRLSHTVGVPTADRKVISLLGLGKSVWRSSDFSFRRTTYGLQVLSLAALVLFKMSLGKMFSSSVSFIFLMSSGILLISVQGKSLF